MRLEQLDYLITVSKTKSLNLAAERLHISQQALSMTVKNLEEEFGGKFFIRTHNGVHLTDDGRYMLERAQDILDIVGEVKKRFLNQAQLNGVLDLYVMPALYSVALSQAITAFAKKHPFVTINIIKKDFSFILDQMDSAEENAHCIINLVSIDKNSQQKIDAMDHLYYEELYANEFEACMRSDNPLAKHKCLSIKKILEQPIVLYTSGEMVDSMLYQLLRTFGEPNIVLVLDNDDLYHSSIENGMGIGFKTSLTRNVSAYSNEEDFCYIPIKEKLATSLGYLIAKDGDCEIVSEFIPLLKDTLGLLMEANQGAAKSTEGKAD